MAVRGVGAYFAIEDGSSPSTLTDVSHYLNKIDGSSDPARLDATCFQPNVAVPLKAEIGGFDTKGFTLTGVWTPGSETFFTALAGVEGVNYVYGPQGSTAGQTRIHGTCNVLSYSGPQSDVQGITSFTVQISVTSRAVNTF